MLRDLARATLPSLRVVGLVYTTLGGVAAMVLVIAVATLPTTPIAQQVVEPARQVVSNLIQPTTDLVTSLIVVPDVQVVASKPAAPTPAPFVATTTLDISIDAVPEPTPAVVLRPVIPYVAASPVVLPTGEAEPVEEEQPEEQPQEQMSQSPAAPDVVQPAETPVMRIANVDPPQALPTPTPVLTPQQVKARMEAANQAAIDAAKAAQARAKAEAEAANKAAIDALKLAEVSNAPAMADSELILPTPAPKANAKAAADATKEAAAKAKAAAEAANQAAIAAAKAAKSGKH